MKMLMLMRLDWPELGTPSFFYLYPSQLIESIEELKGRLVAMEGIDKDALETAVKIVERTGGPGITHHHRPFV